MRNVKMLRGREGLTQIELAEKLGINRGTLVIAEAENDKPLSKSLTKKMCEVFKVKEWELYGIANLIYKPETKEELEKFIEIIRKEYE